MEKTKQKMTLSPSTQEILLIISRWCLRTLIKSKIIEILRRMARLNVNLSFHFSRSVTFTAPIGIYNHLNSLMDLYKRTDTKVLSRQLRTEVQTINFLVISVSGTTFKSRHSMVPLR